MGFNSCVSSILTPATKNMTRETIFSATKKDFCVEYFNGKGKGGQHRNKKACCARITYIPTGLQVECTEFRSREQNKKTAFRRLSQKLVQDALENDGEEREKIEEVIRTYHEPRGTVKDHRTGEIGSYQKVLDGGLNEFIEAMLLKETEHAGFA